jgi:S-adenosylmethionine hydrolase
LDQRRYWLLRVSNTFHGRDIFSPSAAHLAKGVPFAQLGTPIREWVSLATPPVEQRDGRLIGRVIYVDRYGNIVTDISDKHIGALGPDKSPIVEIGGTTIRGLVNTYSDVGKGEIAALIGSPWKLEIAQREGNAARTLGVKIGDPVTVRRTDKK